MKLYVGSCIIGLHKFWLGLDLCPTQIFCYIYIYRIKGRQIRLRYIWVDSVNLRCVIKIFFGGIYHPSETRDLLLNQTEDLGDPRVIKNSLAHMS
jgi:hypothetical protein